jgi:cobalt-zinc-cadmium resistance protein CzcA
MAEAESQLAERDVLLQVSQTWLEGQYWQQVSVQLAWLDSLYGEFARASARRFELGESNYLEKITAESKQKEWQLRKEQALASYAEACLRLRGWLRTAEVPTIAAGLPKRLTLSPADTAGHPASTWFAQAAERQAAAVQVQQQGLLPDLNLSLFAGTNRGPDAQIYKGIQAGVGIPLAFGAQRSRIQASRLEADILDQQSRNFEQHQRAEWDALGEALGKFAVALNWYETDGKQLVAEIRRTATRAWQAGEIDYFSYIQSLEYARNTELNWLENLWHYNQTILEIQYSTWQ